MFGGSCRAYGVLPPPSSPRLVAVLNVMLRSPVRAPRPGAGDHGGDRETGVSILLLAGGSDTVPSTARTCRDDRHGVPSLKRCKLAPSMLDTLDRLGTDAPGPQDDDQATYADKLTPADAVIHWRRDATVLDRQVRALSGRVAAYTTADDGTRIRILAARPAAQDAAGSPGTLVRARWAGPCLGVGGWCSTPAASTRKGTRCRCKRERYRASFRRSPSALDSATRRARRRPAPAARHRTARIVRIR